MTQKTKAGKRTAVDDGKGKQGIGGKNGGQDRSRKRETVAEILDSLPGKPTRVQDISKRQLRKTDVQTRLVAADPQLIRAIVEKGVPLRGKAVKDAVAADSSLVDYLMGDEVRLPRGLADSLQDLGVEAGAEVPVLEGDVAQVLTMNDDGSYTVRELGFNPNDIFEGQDVDAETFLVGRTGAEVVIQTLMTGEWRTLVEGETERLVGVAVSRFQSSEELRDAAAGYQRVAEQLTANVAELNRRIAVLGEGGTTEEKQEIEARIGDCERKLETFREGLTLADEAIDRAMRAEGRVRDERGRAEERRDTLKREIDESEQEMKTLDRDIGKAREEIAELDGELTEFGRRLEELETELRALNFDVANGGWFAVGDSEDGIRAMAPLGEDRVSTTQLLASTEELEALRKVEQLRSEKKKGDVTEERDRVQENIRAAEDAIRELRESIDENEQGMEGHREANDERVRERRELDGEIERLDAEFGRLGDAKQEAHESRAQFEGHVEGVGIAIEELRKELDRLPESLETVRDELAVDRGRELARKRVEIESERSRLDETFWKSAKPLEENVLGENGFSGTMTDLVKAMTKGDAEAIARVRALLDRLEGRGAQ